MFPVPILLIVICVIQCGHSTDFQTYLYHDAVLILQKIKQKGHLRVLQYGKVQISR